MTFLQDATPAERQALLPSSSQSVMPWEKVSQPVFGKLFFPLSRAVGLATASIWNDIINKDCTLSRPSRLGLRFNQPGEQTGMCKSKNKKGEEGEQECEKNRLYLYMHSEVCTNLFQGKSRIKFCKKRIMHEVVDSLFTVLMSSFSPH